MIVRTDQIKALANETRMNILRVLDDPGRHFAHQESADPVEIGVCVQLLAEHFGVSQPTMSRHVELLKRANFLSARRRQKWTYCSRNEAALRDYNEWLVATLKLKVE
ncbi:metalloregulator ArsR/SmtB family transcription factor (plasmid) [Thioclava litoralis]|uniref:Metalloregulator ArsR/SmtB family transcription factor n=2 Tax=Thioclava litoralis TaxID=3076557 RepID=A0ABZ1E2R5_9RHOB|nr:metalloregulator ArsR/SmtB family transcription factor [Thioclava sp. FTW29]